MKHPAYINHQSIQFFVQNALDEDIGVGLGSGDHSSIAIVSAEEIGRAKCLLKDHGILAGIDLAKAIYEIATPAIAIEILMQDGEHFEKGQIAFTIEGPVRDILKTERLILNCMQRMSAIATHTQRLTKLIAHTKCRLLDTRKTTPNYRLAEKWAVVIGGGTNHRFGLYDMVMLKDNHVDYAGGVEAAIAKTKQYLLYNQLNIPIEVETRNLKEVEQALNAGGVLRIMLDNMPLEMMREAVQIINGRVETEASGGITESSIAAVAETGVDFISVGALTHQVHSLDISLKAY